MEKIKKEEVKKLHSDIALLITMDKVNEVVDWIKNHEKITVKDRDWFLARLEEIGSRPLPRNKSTRESAIPDI